MVLVEAIGRAPGKVVRVPDILVEGGCGDRLDGLAHDLGLGPEGVDQWVVLDYECTYE
jgi:hypothetical protein